MTDQGAVVGWDGGEAATPESERPALAPGVRLIGPQQGTSFRESQWLAEREGSFVQLSELLYRTLEQLDGTRGLDAIAARLTDATPWTVTTRNVRDILSRKLIPLGLVVIGGGEPARRARREARSPLAVNLRVRVVGPKLLEPVARAASLAYTPLVLLPALAIVAAAHVWLFAEHGLGDPLREVLFHPLLLIAVFGIFVLTAAVHELGHAAALSYGGGKVRGVGVGVYLVYPIFFTDTTDAYRLSRWSRVRVDLGGFYFHLLAAVAVIGLAVVSGWEWLLVVALIIDLEVLRQLLFPFLRLDGYWLLADLTGVPDFFSQMGPFLRSVLPFRRSSGAKLPPLRPLARAVFALYVLLAVPVLGFLLYQSVVRLPELAGVAGDSLQIQATVLQASLDQGDLSAAATAAVQALILAAPAIGTVLLLTVLLVWAARSLARRLADPKRSAARAA